MNRRQLFKMMALAFAGTTGSILESKKKPDPEKALKTFKELHTPWAAQCGKSELQREHFKALMELDDSAVMYIVPKDTNG